MKIFIITRNYSTRSRGTGNVSRRGLDTRQCSRRRGKRNVRRRGPDSA